MANPWRYHHFTTSNFKAHPRDWQTRISQTDAIRTFGHSPFISVIYDHPFPFIKSHLWGKLNEGPGHSLDSKKLLVEKHIWLREEQAIHRPHLWPVFSEKTVQKWEKLPSRELTYPTEREKENHLQNANFGDMLVYYSLLEGTVSWCPSPIVCQEFWWFFKCGGGSHWNIWKTSYPNDYKRDWPKGYFLN